MRLGDLFASVTKAVGIQPCEACLRRQALLNRWGESALSALKGGPGACELAREERDEAIRLLGELEPLGDERRRAEGQEEAFDRAKGWWQAAAWRSASYGCEPLTIIV